MTAFDRRGKPRRSVIKLRTFNGVENSVGCVATHQYQVDNLRIVTVYDRDDGALQRTLHRKHL